jgi:hypothetical protein
MAEDAFPVLPAFPALHAFGLDPLEFDEAELFGDVGWEEEDLGEDLGPGLQLHDDDDETLDDAYAELVLANTVTSERPQTWELVKVSGHGVSSAARSKHQSPSSYSHGAF